MDRNLDFEAAIIANDLDSLALRIEGLQAHPRYTEAGAAVRAAKQAVIDGRSDIHQREMQARFAKTPAERISDAARVDPADMRRPTTNFSGRR